MKKYFNSLFCFFLLLLLILLLRDNAHAGFPPSTPPITQLLFTDQFTGFDGTELSQYNPDWIPRLAEIQNSYISNNEIVSTTNNAGYYYSALQNLSNACVSVDFHSEWGYASWVSLETRYTNNGGEHSYIASIDNKNSYSIGKDYTAVKSGGIPTGDLDTGWHNLVLCSIDTTHAIYLDNTLLDSFTDNSYSQGYVGFNTGPNMYVDNFTVNSTDVKNLNVPNLKQDASPWGHQLYDSANIWSHRTQTIASWGCALTSAAMVFQYHGVKKLPDGSNLDPGTLNSWLKNQKDGYVRNGLVNWLSLTRLSKLAKNINNLPYDALEYIRKNTTDKTVLTSDINAGLPDILQEPGHFIVAKGINGSTYDINDPYYNRNLLTDNYNNNFLSLGTFKPSNTNLSYIMIVVNKGINVSLSGNNSSDGQLTLQEYINDAQNENKSTEQVNIYYLPKPATGDYLVDLSSNSASDFNLDIYSYDQNGNVFVSKKHGRIGQNGNVSIPLKFTNILYPKKVTYFSTILDLEKNNFTKYGVLKGNLLQILIKAKVQNLLGNREKELFYLGSFLDLLSKYEKSIPPSTYSNLVYDANYLSSDH